jgi:hypothetical protein
MIDRPSTRPEKPTIIPDVRHKQANSVVLII